MQTDTHDCSSANRIFAIARLNHFCQCSILEMMRGDPLREHWPAHDVNLILFCYVHVHRDATGTESRTTNWDWAAWVQHVARLRLEGGSYYWSWTERYGSYSNVFWREGWEIKCKGIFEHETLIAYMLLHIPTQCNVSFIYHRVFYHHVCTSAYQLN